VIARCWNKNAGDDETWKPIGAARARPRRRGCRPTRPGGVTDGWLTGSDGQAGAGQKCFKLKASLCEFTDPDLCRRPKVPGVAAR
jgi:hypothetical protein